MAKRKPSELKIRPKPLEIARSAASEAKNADSWFSAVAIRETVESVIIAFVLAFLFRTFEAEAFVIPTGSMAPTLMGKHKDLECPMCRYRYQVSASDHPNSDVATNVYNSTCPMCRFTADLTPKNPQNQSYPSYDGDRILVAKFLYEFADPKRWDVIVFKYPGDSTMNYIKRLVGLPGETINIHGGDLWIHKPDQPEGYFEIARKPPEKVLAMLQPVYDNDLAPTITGKMHWPARWTVDSGTGDNFWSSKDLSSFEVEGSAKGEAWIRYRHRVPTHDQWRSLAASTGKESEKLTRDDCEKGMGLNDPFQESILPQLISDFTAYNTGFSDQSEGSFKSLIERGYGQHWVGDLAVQFELESKLASGKVVAELIKGGRHFQCRFDLSSGKAELAIGGGGPEADGYHREATTAILGAGQHSIRFANVDDELTLWVDGKVVAFQDATQPDASRSSDGQTESEKHPNRYNSALLNNHVPTAEDLSPVGIAAEAATVKVSHIKVLRDVYYIAAFNEGKPQTTGRLLQDFISRPDLSNSRSWEYDFSKANMRTCKIEIKAPDPAHPERDRFFVLGDNSAQSSDGRLWVGEWSVERELLIGKALFIYWPHGWKIPYVPLPFNVVPYFQRMHFVR